MDIIHIGTKVYGTQPVPQTPAESSAKHDRILAEANVPIEMTRCVSIDYDTKAQLYKATFTRSEGIKTALRVTNDVAAFLAEHQTRPGYWRGRMQDGILVDVVLVQMD